MLIGCGMPLRRAQKHIGQLPPRHQRQPGLDLTLDAPALQATRLSPAEACALFGTVSLSAGEMPTLGRPSLCPPGLSESRRIARQRLAIRDSVKISASAIRRFGDSVIPRIKGCQPDRAGPGRAQRQSYAAQATQATHLHYPKQTS